jgi:chemotaxis receptor (MCP) glutamine deamidase CheD
MIATPIILSSAFSLIMGGMTEPQTQGISAHPAYGAQVIAPAFEERAAGPEMSPRLAELRQSRPAPAQGEFNASEARAIYIRGYGVTSAQDSKPVLGTSGMGPCLGVAIYNPAQKTGAVAHFDTNTDLSSLDRLMESVGGKDQKLDIHLAGGQLGSEHSHRMVEQIIEKIGQRGNVTIKSADVMDPAGGLKAIALDTRTGETSNRFMGTQLDKGPYWQDTMMHHAGTAMQRLPLRPEYVDGQSYPPQATPALSPQIRTDPAPPPGQP